MNRKGKKLLVSLLCLLFALSVGVASASAEDAKQFENVLSSRNGATVETLKPMAARFVAWDPEDPNFFTIDKGSADGVRSDMSVITLDGLVGLVCETDANTAKVMTIRLHFLTSTLYATLKGSTGLKYFICWNDGDEPSYSFMHMGSDPIRPDEAVYTSNFAHFPGIKIGQVVVPENGVPEEDGRIVFSADFKNLDEVWVLLGEDINTLPSDLKKDL